MKRACVAAVLTLLASAAHAYTLDFGSSGAPAICAGNAQGTGAFVQCGDGSYLNQAYGDVAGSVNATYSSVTVPGESLHWWDASYNDLHGVPYSSGNDELSHARIELATLAGPMTLTHFDFGAYPNTSRATTIDVYAIGGGASLFHYAGPVGAPPTHTSFDTSLTSNTGFWIEWQNSAYNVGIDNIAFAVAATVPEPETTALLISGFGLLAFVARRRRRSG